MTRSIRVVYDAVQGTVRKNWNWDMINERSAVLVTACEWKRDHYDSPWGEGLHPQVMVLAGRTWLGPSKIYVTNIGVHGRHPEAGGVEFLLHVEQRQPVDVQVTITYLGQVEDTEYLPGTEPMWVNA